MGIKQIITNRIRKLEKNFAVYNNIYISKSALLHNYDLLGKLSPGDLVIPVLKSNAYGHGIKQVATILKSRKPPYVAVDGYYEGLRVHEVSNQKVLVMGMIKSENFKLINPKGFAFSVHDVETIKAIGKTKMEFVVHIEIETGMGRHGARLDELEYLLSVIKQYDNIIVEGVMTHLADADNPNDTSHVKLQTKRFDQSIEIILKNGFKPKYYHIAQSAGSTKVKSKYANIIRTGLAFYGVNPLETSDKNYKKLAGLRPALTLNSTVSKIIKIDLDESVSYNRTFIAKKNSLVGVLPIGYYEGLPRSLSNVGKVFIDNKLHNFAGRICMNHAMIDISETKTKVGDIATIISSNPGSALSVKNLCSKYNLFNYGLLSGLNENIRRTIIE